MPKPDFQIWTSVCASYASSVPDTTKLPAQQTASMRLKFFRWPTPLMIDAPYPLILKRPTERVRCRLLWINGNSRMPLKDQINFLYRWPVIKSLQQRIRRILSSDSGQRKLKMPVLETERLVLRPLDQHDLGDILAWEETTWAQNPGVAAQQFLDYCFREYIERGIGPWGIQLKETGAIVGNCGFPHILLEKHCGEVNCYIASRLRGQGLACEALQALFLWGFRDIGLTRIQARCEQDNLASQRLAEKAGMRFEGWIESAPSSKDSSPKQKFFAILQRDFHIGNDSAAGRAIDIKSSHK